MRWVLRFLVMIVPPRTRHRPIWYFTSRSATPGLSTDIQHGPIGFRGPCRTLQTRECTCQLEIKTFSPRSAQALIDSCLCLLSRKRYPFRCSINSGMAGRQISSRIRTSKYRTRLEDTGHPGGASSSTSCLPFAAKSHNTWAVAKRCSRAVRPSLCGEVVKRVWGVRPRPPQPFRDS